MLWIRLIFCVQLSSWKRRWVLISVRIAKIIKIGDVFCTAALIFGFIFGIYYIAFSHKDNAKEIPSTRTVSGVVTNKEISSDSDTSNIQIQTEDGNIWFLNDFVMNRNAVVEVEFNTMETEVLEDDVIISVKAFVEQ